jgi:hypothetical protein
VYPRWSIIYVGCCAQLSKCVSVAASQKIQFWHSENGKRAFCGKKRKTASVAVLVVPRATHVSDMIVLANYAMIKAMT